MYQISVTALVDFPARIQQINHHLCLELILGVYPIWWCPMYEAKFYSFISGQFMTTHGWTYLGGEPFPPWQRQKTLHIQPHHYRVSAVLIMARHLISSSLKLTNDECGREWLINWAAWDGLVCNCISVQQIVCNSTCSALGPALCMLRMISSTFPLSLIKTEGFTSSGI